LLYKMRKLGIEGRRSSRTAVQSELLYGGNLTSAPPNRNFEATAAVC
jgi:hypothetical protein